MVLWLFVAAFLLHQAAGQVALTTPPYTRLVRTVTYIDMSENGEYVAVGKIRDGVYVYNKTAGSWSATAVKLPADWSTNDIYDVITVSLSYDGSYLAASGSQAGTGVSRVFVRNGEAWSQQSSGLVITDLSGSFIGSSSDISGDALYIALGSYTDNSATGAAWAFSRSGTVWTQQGGKLVGSGATGTCGQGYSVSINYDGTYLVSGGIADNNNVGATWVFARSGSSWAQQSGKLVGTGLATSSSKQGYSVSVDASGLYISVGGPSDDYYSGAVWVFARSGTVWAQQGSKLTSTSGPMLNRVGRTAAISSDGSQIIIGALTTSAVVFTRSGSSWSAAQSYSASGELGFGRNVAIALTGYVLAISGVDATWVVELPTPSPIPVPTLPPTPFPSASPTRLPTALPTALPTIVPSVAPASPTRLPTALPTALPTIVPSAAPTSLPTTLPTALPTIVPSAAPTSLPTTLPTRLPTQLPTRLPTSLQTVVPTALPTDAPVSAPTPMPTALPTSAPTPMPTALPTRLPTSAPTPPSTRLPTALPTRLPTSAPTPPSTRLPTALPTRLPTSAPTPLPTRLPTALPTPLPTRLPTTLPSAAPVGPTTTVPTRSPHVATPVAGSLGEDAGAIISLTIAVLGGMVLLALTVRFFVMYWVLDIRHPIPVGRSIENVTGNKMTGTFTVDTFKN